MQIGGTYAKPVIMPPEVAIGAIGRIQVCFTLTGFNFGVVPYVGRVCCWFSPCYKGFSLGFGFFLFLQKTNTTNSSSPGYRTGMKTS